MEFHDPEGTPTAPPQAQCLLQATVQAGAPSADTTIGLEATVKFMGKCLRLAVEWNLDKHNSSD